VGYRRETIGHGENGVRTFIVERISLRFERNEFRSTDRLDRSEFRFTKLLKRNEFRFTDRGLRIVKDQRRSVVGASCVSGEVAFAFFYPLAMRLRAENGAS
jgi:hypothetical protein